MTDLTNQSWLQDERLARLFGVIEAAGGEARVAGGAVRNGLWGLPVADIDVATTLLPDVVMKECKAAGFSVHATGLAHGTVTVVIDQLVVEVTTLRADVETDGRRAVVAFTLDWHMDAERRDLTINSLYCDLPGHVYEEIDGALEDHRQRRIRFAGVPEQRIREDYLRILRFFRFEARFGCGQMDEASLEACVALQDGLEKLSAERICAELLKTIIAPRARPVLQVMADRGILQRLISFGGSFEPFGRMVEIESILGLEPDAIARLATLTKSASHLRLSNNDHGRFKNMVGCDEFADGFKEADHKQLAYRFGAQLYRDCVLMSYCRSDDEPGIWVSRYQLLDNWEIPVFPISGADLIKAGFAPGKGLGQLLAELEAYWVGRVFADGQEDLINRAKEIKHQSD